jgi:16S rRNA (guanine527-N7)-methyltransferase
MSAVLLRPLTAVRFPREVGLEQGSGIDELDDRAFRERMQEQAEAVGLRLDPTWMGQFEDYFRLLRRWSRTINLTALPFAGLPDHTLNRLFIEPLQAAQFINDVSLVWFDLGSGGGSPAIPLKVVRPLLKLTMVESTSRKAAFLMEVVRLLALTSADVLSMRMEELARSDAAGQASLLTVRAVKIDDDFWRLSGALLKPGGRLLLFGSASAHPLKRADFRAIDEFRLAGGDSMLRVLTKINE